jgi:hypothetical protein
VIQCAAASGGPQRLATLSPACTAGDSTWGCVGDFGAFEALCLRAGLSYERHMIDFCDWLLAELA